MAKTVAFKDENGQERYVGPGAVAQTGGKLKLYVCNACGSEVVWCPSKRTGRVYLVNVTRGYRDQRFYMGHNIHKCQKQQERAARNAQILQAERDKLNGGN